MFEGFIFDVEGTLVDSACRMPWRNRVTASRFRRFVATPASTLQLAVPEASERERRAILEDRREIFERDYLRA